MNEMFGAAQEALGELARTTDGLDMGKPPGATPIPWRDQAVQFIDDLPDLLKKGPRYQQINKTYGEGAADQYMQEMMADIWSRQRRKPL
jgi:hypothetical protein